MYPSSPQVHFSKLTLTQIHNPLKDNHQKNRIIKMPTTASIGIANPFPCYGKVICGAVGWETIRANSSWLLCIRFLPYNTSFHIKHRKYHPLKFLQFCPGPIAVAAYTQLGKRQCSYLDTGGIDVYVGLNNKSQFKMHTVFSKRYKLFIRANL